MIQWIYGRNSILSRNYERIIYQGVSLPIQFEKLSPKTIKCAWKIGENKFKKKNYKRTIFAGQKWRINWKIKGKTLEKILYLKPKTINSFIENLFIQNKHYFMYFFFYLFLFYISAVQSLHCLHLTIIPFFFNFQGSKYNKNVIVNYQLKKYLPKYINIYNTYKYDKREKIYNYWRKLLPLYCTSCQIFKFLLIFWKFTREQLPHWLI